MSIHTRNIPFRTLIIAYGVLPEQGHYHDSEATVHLRSTSRSICLHRRISNIYAVWRHSCPIRTLPERSGVGRTGQPRRGRSFIIKATLIWVACMILMTFPVPVSQLQTTAPSQTTDRTLFPGYDRYTGLPRRRRFGRRRGVHPGSYPPAESRPHPFFPVH